MIIGRIVPVPLNLSLADKKDNKVITGFNTDVDFDGVTYHVQTEDKGLKSPMIMSLVYHRGTILASKRSPYNDLLIGNFDEKELAERLGRQHKLICAAIKAGRIEELKQMSAKGAKDSKAKQNGTKTSEPIPKPASNLDLPSVETKSSDAQPVLKVPSAKNEAPASEPEARPDFNISSEEAFLEENKVWEIPVSILDESLLDEPVIQTVTIIPDEAPEEVEEEIILPAEAVEIITDFDQNGDSENKLSIELLNETQLKGGERKVLTIQVGNGSGKSAVVGAGIMVKILGSSFRPLIFHAKTDSNGVAVINLQIPNFSRGRAAILIKAVNGGDETEIRRIIQSA